MFKILSNLILVLMVILVLPVGLIMVSQDAVKGDFRYPVKRGLEGGILAIASLTPFTRAYFAVALTNRRYGEVALVIGKGNNAGNELDELVTQTSTAVSDINKISSSDQRAKLIADLSASIQKYDQGLAQAQQEIASKTIISDYQTAPSRGTSQTPAPVATTQSSPLTDRPTSTSPPINTPSPTYQPSQQPRQFTQAPPQGPSRQDEELRRQQEAIEKARRELEELRKRLELEARNFQTQGASQPNTPMQQRQTPDLSPPVSSPNPSAPSSINPQFPLNSQNNNQQNFNRSKEKSKSWENYSEGNGNSGNDNNENHENDDND